MKSEDLLWAVVNMYKYERKTMRQIANSLCISLGTVHETLHRFRQTGDVAHTASKSKKPTILTDLEMKCVREYVLANPAMYLDEYCEIVRRVFDKTISPTTMCRVIKRLGLSRKKLRIIALQRCAEKEIAYCIALEGMFSYQFIFLDETHVDNRCRNRLWGWSAVGERVSQKGFYLRGKKYSCLASINLEGIQAFDTVAGGFNGERFLYFVKHLLLPMTNPFPMPSSVIIMDNASIHHITEVRKTIEDAGRKLVFLPPYSPHLNPIESAFSKMKKFLRRDGTALYESGLTDFNIIDAAIQVVTKQDAVGFFRGCGYY